MGSIAIKLPDNFIRKIEEASERSSEAIDASVKAGCEVMEPIIRQNLVGAIGRNTKGASKSTGELLSALGTSPIKVSADGVHNAKIGFREPRTRQSNANGKRSYKVATNAMVAMVLEYGTKDGRQPARPFLAPARKSGRDLCAKAMEQAFDKVMSEVNT